MKILLIAPCLVQEQRPSSMDIPQLTLSLIAALTPAEHEIQIVEEVYGEIVNFDGDYDVIGISIMSQTCIRGYQIANEFKKRGKAVVFGGIHATAMPDEAIRFGNSVVIGEAEGLWDIVLDDIKHNRLKLFYKLDKLPDLQSHIMPRRDLIKCSSGKFSIAPIETTRGCPYNCDFCTVSRFFGTRQRHKPIRDIISDIESCKENNLFLLDDNITGDKRYAKELFMEMIPHKKIWVGQASIQVASDTELIKLAYKSGCRALLIGFESMSESGINQYRKTLKTVDENILAVKKLQDNGIMTMASLIFGLDSDTPEVFDVAHEFLTLSKAAFFQACVMTPYPGTPVFNKLRSQGRILTDDWNRFDASKVIIRPESISPEELLDGYDKIKWHFYSNISILKRSYPNIKIGFWEAILYLTLNKGYQKRNNPSMFSQVYQNDPDNPVDFNVDKYVYPL
ncbi:MAG: B12-binding domain-containing radical SAM protein [Bacteroidales bacterium]|jgi:radical SAM superfamily enzyme YgiQ (UPF0313 family)|nr:B12-binding domain-containing radical SAM protein [Bacteroidales bacterium]